MACVTLKRSLDFDPLHSPSRPTKRRRCVPLHCTPEKKARDEAAAAPPPQPSVFRENALTPEEIANNLRDEIKRLKKRKQFPGGASSPPSSPSSPSCSSIPPLSPGNAPSSPEPMMMMDDGGAAAACSSSSQQNKEKPIFTLKQMTMIAERMCKERVEQVRIEYDQILQQKLSEQYDAFVKFIDQQIQKRFRESQAPSYLS